MRISDLPLVLWDQARLLETRWRGMARFADPARYFHPASGPDDPALVDELERINADLPAYLDPGPVEAPDPAEVRHQDGLLTFPSPRPTGVVPVDRVAIKLYPAPAGAPRVGVLFHHWVLFERWAHADFLLRPLVGRCRLAAMLAPHHVGRRAPGRGPGEDIINPNPLGLLRSMRQWQADHAAALALLARDHGFERTVILGYSMGAYNALLSFLNRPTLPMVAVCCTNNYERGVFEGNATTHLRAALATVGFTRDRFGRLVRAVHLARYAPRLDTSRLTWIRAREDWIEPRDSLLELPRALRPDVEIEIPGGHASAVFFRRLIAREVLRRVDAETTGGEPGRVARGPG